MRFTATGVTEFLAIFDRNKMAIRNAPGCTHLELLRDSEDSNCFTTLSHWQDPDSLNTYRKSQLFYEVWRPVKSLFAAKAQAFSLEKFMEV